MNSILGVIVGFFAAIFSVFSLGHSITVPPVATSVITVASSSDPISVSGMTKYTDVDFGFSFWYPSTWSVTHVPYNSGKDGGGNVLKLLDISQTSGQNTIEIYEMNDPNESQVVTPSAGCLATYFYNSDNKKWMQKMSGCDQQETTLLVTDATMGGLPILFTQNGLSTQSYIIPLSAKSANKTLLVTPLGSYTNLKATVETIAATDPSVATPVSAAEQIKIIQAEQQAYAGQ